MFVKAYWLLLSGVALACMGAGSAAAEPVDERELGRWVPSFSLLSGISAQKAEGHLATSDIVGPEDPAGNSEHPLLPGTPATDRTRMMTPFVGGSIELMTPAWKSLPGRPRAYVHGDVAFAFAPDYNIPMIADPGPFVVSSTVTGAITEGQILGQGGKTTATVGPLLVMAGAGFAFTLDAWDHALRIKPSFEYMREEIEISGVVRRAIRVESPSPTLDEFRLVTLTAQKAQVYHGLGAGLEVELDTARAGPFVLSLYAAAKAWNFLDNEKQTLTDQNQYGEHAVWHFLKNEWAFAGALGLRFRWVPQ
jgi:hypothetical protein